MLVLLPDQSLTFSSSDHFKYKVLKYAMQSTSKIVVIDGRFVRTIDATVAKVIFTVKIAKITLFRVMNDVIMCVFEKSLNT